MSEIDYEELFQSPLDDPVTARWWRAGAAGFGVGVVAVLLLALTLAGDDETTAVVDSSSLPTTVIPTPVAADFPAGFVEIGPGIAAKPAELVRGDETITLAFTTAVKRGGDPLAPVYPVGGTWWLESVDGAGVESHRLILGRFSPSAFAVEFSATPFGGDVGFSRAIMIDRWDQRELTGSSSLPFSGEPFVMAEPLTIPVTQEITLVVERLELGRFLGRVDWVIEGPGDPVARVLIAATLVDVDGNAVGSYSAFPELLDPASVGTTEITWGQPFPTTQEGAVTVVVEYTVGLVETVATDVVIDLTDVDVGR